MLRTDLIMPVEWQSTLVHALTIETLNDEAIGEILALRRIKSGRKSLRRAVAIGCQCPAGLVALLCDRDLERSAEMVTRAIRERSMDLVRCPQT